MPLDPQAKKLLDQLVAMGRPPVSTLTPTEARQSLKGEQGDAGGNLKTPIR